MKPTHPLLSSTFVVFLALLFPAYLCGQTTGTTTLSLAVTSEASITVNTATTSLTAASTTTPFVGTTSFTYIVRTTQTTGVGSIVVKITTDFAPTAGPSVASPPTAGDTLTYTCTAAVGTACATAQTASTASSTNVVSFGADVHSAVAGSAGTVVWALTNDPVYKSGTYTATATFTISAT